MKRGLGSDLSGRVILITGGGTGIGAATAVACAQAGMDVCVVGKRIEPLQRVAAKVGEFGQRGIPLAMDVTEHKASQRMLDHVEGTLGRCDAVFANAGYGMEKPVFHMDEEEVRRMIDVNLVASALLLSEAARRFIEQKKPGHLLACSSCLAKFTMPGFGLYSATKAGQNMICRGMRLACRRHGIEVSSVHPIGTHTEFVDVALELSGEHAGILKKQLPDSGMGGLFIQKPERVGRAVVRGLRRPRAEIWTSISMRLLGGFFEFCPPLYDLMHHVAARQSAQAVEKG